MGLNKNAKNLIEYERKWYKLISLIPSENIPPDCKAILVTFTFQQHDGGLMNRPMDNDYVWLPYPAKINKRLARLTKNTDFRKQK